MKVLPTLFIFSTIFVIETSTRMLSDSQLERVECSILSILMEKIKESDECNLKTLLRKELLTPKIKQEDVRLSRKRNLFKYEIGTCEIGEQCRVSGRRTCLCPSTFVCEPNSINTYSCVKLGYYQLMEQ